MYWSLISDFVSSLAQLMSWTILRITSFFSSDPAVDFLFALTFLFLRVVGWDFQDLFIRTGANSFISGSLLASSQLLWNENKVSPWREYIWKSWEKIEIISRIFDFSFFPMISNIIFRHGKQYFVFKIFCSAHKKTPDMKGSAPCEYWIHHIN